MGRLTSKRARDTTGAIAALVLAITCLVAAVFHTRALLDLEANGESASAVVIGMHRGARNSKWAIYRFTTAGGEAVTARDLFQQYLRGVDAGETVPVIYHRGDSSRVTADLGPWNWQGPVIFGGGFLLLAVLAVLIWRHRKT